MTRVKHIAPYNTVEHATRHLPVCGLVGQQPDQECLRARTTRRRVSQAFTYGVGQCCITEYVCFDRRTFMHNFYYKEGTHYLNCKTTVILSDL